MSSEDKRRWNARYKAGAYAHRLHPSALLEQWVDQHPAKTGARALDVACGAGRNSHYLAHKGYQVLGLDVSSEALDRARARVESNSRVQAPRFVERDLDFGLPEADVANNCQVDTYDLICLFRYLDLDLTGRLLQHLAPGGVLLVEVNLQVPPQTQVAGPATSHQGSRFRAAPGALLHAVEQGVEQGLEQGFVVEHAVEGLFVDPDGKDAALARVIVRRK